MSLARNDGGYFMHPSYYNTPNVNVTLYYEIGDQPKYCMAKYASLPDTFNGTYYSYAYERSWTQGIQNACGGGN